MSQHWPLTIETAEPMNHVKPFAPFKHVLATRACDLKPVVCISRSTSIALVKTLFKALIYSHPPSVPPVDISLTLYSANTKATLDAMNSQCGTGEATPVAGYENSWKMSRKGKAGSRLVKIFACWLVACSTKPISFRVFIGRPDLAKWNNIS